MKVKVRILSLLLVLVLAFGTFVGCLPGGFVEEVEGASQMGTDTQATNQASGESESLINPFDTEDSSFGDDIYDDYVDSEDFSDYATESETDFVFDLTTDTESADVSDETFIDTDLSGDSTESETLPSSESDKPSATETAKPSATETTKPAATTNNLILAKNKVAGYKVISFFSACSEVTTFVNNLKTKTGASFTVSYSTSSIGGRQIVLGTFDQISRYLGAPTFKSWTGAALAASGETIYIGAVDKELLTKITTAFISKITEVETNKFGVVENLKLVADKCNISESVPKFENTAGTYKGLYSSGGGNYQVTYKSINSADVTTYRSKLTTAGYSLHQSNTINGNSFYTYVKGNTIVHINWFAKLSQFSIIYGPKTYLPAKSAITGYTKRVTPTITQLALGETGLSQVIQLEDGSFILIDGGLGSSSCYSKDSATLMNFLTAKAPNGEKPRVTWIVTHIHTDHRQLFQKLLPSIKDKIQLELVVWNMPDFATLSQYTPNWKETNPPENYVTSMNLIKTALSKSFPNVPIYTFHTGERLYLPGCQIEFLVCHEDYYLNNFVWINDTSSAFRVTMQGKTMMVFGDCTSEVNDAIMTKAFGNYIKSDIMQITHHGVGGGTLDTFKAVNPTICLWSLNRVKYETDNRALGTKSEAVSCNKWIRANCSRHYHHSYTTTLTIPSLTATVTKVYTDI